MPSYDTPPRPLRFDFQHAIDRLYVLHPQTCNQTVFAHESEPDQPRIYPEHFAKEEIDLAEHIIAHYSACKAPGEPWPYKGDFGIKGQFNVLCLYHMQWADIRIGCPSERGYFTLHHEFAHLLEKRDLADEYRLYLKYGQDIGIALSAVPRENAADGYGMIQHIAMGGKDDFSRLAEDRAFSAVIRRYDDGLPDPGHFTSVTLDKIARIDPARLRCLNGDQMIGLARLCAKAYTPPRYSTLRMFEYVDMFDRDFRQAPKGDDGPLLRHARRMLDSKSPHIVYAASAAFTWLLREGGKEDGLPALEGEEWDGIRGEIKGYHDIIPDDPRVTAFLARPQRPRAPKNAA